MTVPYCFHCSVCKKDYSSKSQWLNHLTQEEHQNLAKQKCCLNWRKPDKDKCLVIYSSFPVTVTSGGAHKVIQYFSSNLRNWVTDFVNWEERPYFAIVQFESRKKAQQIVSAITKPNLRIDGWLVQVKLASELWDLEWTSHLPSYSFQETNNNLVQSKRKQSFITTDEPTESATKKPKKDNPIVAPLVDKGLRKIVSYLNLCVHQLGWEPPKYQCIEHRGPNNSSSWSCSVTLNGVEYSPSEGMPKRRRNDAMRLAAFMAYQDILLKTGDDNPSNKICPFGLDPVYWSSCPVNSLQNQFWKACETVTLPDDKYNMFLNLGRYLETLFCEIEPQSRVVLFGNYYLKLADPRWKSNDKLLYYVYNTGRSSSYISITTVKTVFNSPAGKRAFSTGNQCSKKGTVNWGPKYIYKCIDGHFTVVTNEHLKVEVQLCRLLEYLCLFDNRCYSLLAMCWFWHKQNEINFRPQTDPVEKLGVTSDPLTREWLVIHYLCHKGILPTVREIQQRSHVEEYYKDVDISFMADPEFVQEWKSGRKEQEIEQCSEEFVLSVLELFQGFLKFYGETLAKGKWILTTRDGNIIKMDNGLPEMYKSDETPHADLNQCDLYMVNPLICTWRFKLNIFIHRIQYSMKRTAQQLETYLKMRKWESSETEVNLTEVLTYKRP